MIFEAIETVLAKEMNCDLVDDHFFHGGLWIMLGEKLVTQSLEKRAVFGVQAGDEDGIGCGEAVFMGVAGWTRLGVMNGGDHVFQGVR